MGFLDELVKSSSRFQNSVQPPGYAKRAITWVINLSANDQEAPTISKKSEKELMLSSPRTPSDRTSTNVSPTLLVDKISYVTGFPDFKKKRDPNEISSKEHKSYLELLRTCFEETKNVQIKRIYQFLQNCSPYIPKAKPGDLCAFQIEQCPWPTDNKEIQAFWTNYVAERLAESKQQCVVCRITTPITRILPFKITLIKGSNPVQLSSFNLDVFQSLGKTTAEVNEGKGKKKKKRKRAGANAAVCYSCASTAGQVLQYLVTLEPGKEGKEKNYGRHAVILARDDSKGKGKQPLRNQIAVFWTKELIEFSVNDEEKKTFEELTKCPLEDFDEIPDNEIPVKAGQFRELLKAPFAGGRNRADLPTNRFFLAILSPTKSRLVVREWLDTDVGQVSENISRYMDSLQIIHPDGRGVWAPPLPALLEALQSYTSTKQKGKEGPRISALGPDVTRKLIRCIYTGTPPPEFLLHRALRCFRVPDPSTDDTIHGKEQRGRQVLRRMAMVAAMKLVLTHNDNNKKERKAMEQSKTDQDKESTYKKKAPYNCGRLLAVLEAIQRRASSSGRGVNTTLVDRFYGTASTAPATVFANLISMATKAHLPKLRRMGKGKEYFHVQGGSININDMMADVCKLIDEAGGFPPPLKPEQQAQFALGFYHQRAELTTHKSSKNT